MNTPTTSLLIYDAEGNKHEMALSHNALGYALNSVENTEENAKFFEFLATHPAEHVRQALAQNDFLTEKTIRILSRDKSVSVLRNLVWRIAYRKYATEEDINYAIDLNVEVAVEIARNVTEFKKVSKQKILKKLLSCKDPAILEIVAGSYDTPKNIVKQLEKHSDGAVRYSAKNWRN